MSVSNMFKDGNLTIVFDKPVVIPKILSEAVRHTRALEDQQ